jgi:hypothetical protein
MTLPPAITNRILDAAGRELAAIMREEIAENQLLTIQQAADLMHVSKPTARAIIGSVVALTENITRVEKSKVTEIINARRVPA